MFSQSNCFKRSKNMPADLNGVMRSSTVPQPACRCWNKPMLSESLPTASCRKLNDSGTALLAHIFSGLPDSTNAVATPMIAAATPRPASFADRAISWAKNSGPQSGPFHEPSAASRFSSESSGSPALLTPTPLAFSDFRPRCFAARSNNSCALPKLLPLDEPEVVDTADEPEAADTADAVSDNASATCSAPLA